MDGTYVKLFRSIQQWEWYTDPSVKITFLHCLVQANRFERRHKGTLIESGSFPTSYEKFAIECGLTVQQVRTSLKKLKSTGELTYKSTNDGTIISVVKWGDYQSGEDSANTQINTQDNKPTTNEQQTDNKRITTLKNDKKEKNDKNTTKEGGFTPPTVSEVSDFITEMKYGVDAQRFVSFYASKNWMVGKNKMKDWRSAVTGWNTRDNKTGRVEPIPDYGTETTMTPDQIEELKARLRRT